MGAGSNKVKDLLEAVRRPIVYTCEGDLSRVSVVKNLAGYVIRRLRTGIATAETVSDRRDLQSLLTLFSDYDRLSLRVRKERLLEARRLIDRLSDRVAAAGQERRAAPKAPLRWEMEVQYLKGVGAGRAGQLARLGVFKLEDLLYFLPWRYEDRSRLQKIAELTPGQDHTLCVRIYSTRLHRTPKKKFQIFELVVGDETGGLRVKWFNQAYLSRVLRKGQRVMLSGRVRPNAYEGHLEMENPQFEILSHEDGSDRGELIHTGRVVPVYHETRGFSSRAIRTLMKAALDTWGDCIPEVLPRPMLARCGLVPLNEALPRVHFPDGTQDLAALNRRDTPYHRRLVFEDFFLLQLGLAFQRREVELEKEGIAFCVREPVLERFWAGLPFRMTGAQARVLEDIKKDMAASRPMNRLLQGDVGCGKTLVAASALLLAVADGYQGAFMAPTEILAEQHYLNVNRWFSGLGIRAALLTGGLPPRKRREVGRQVRDGEVQVVVGTHALIQADVAFQRLGLAVIDEQHKFGVLQRRHLLQKGYHPDVLIMTATPIPRTLALSVYGDMDVSVIDELPPGRRPVTTRLLEESNRGKAYEFIHRQLSAGRQTYVVYPLVEQSEKTDLKAATEMAGHLAEKVFPRWRVGLLHGQMSPEEKEKVMLAFKDHGIDLLVATSVIEVGIDVPNAAVILIEHAERFGLAQLHQLRGRVGRSGHPSTCLLMAGEGLTEEGKKRLDVLVRHQDGFAIAEWDLSFRGPGEFFGTRQSGLPELRVANLLRDGKILEAARREAFGLLKKDPDLQRPEHRPLREAVHRRWRDKLSWVATG